MPKVLLKEIEICRKEMIALANEHGLNSESVIHCSKKLDDLLNQYQKKKKSNALN
ncbi:Spo0E family sporulation regulatory protein-aspartic acid phosphatase [Virgibacillus halophilus]|uniref:Aspartyl-phosphate phosphatase Spo0E family protein n=1 Tax=Tigheibacillus halophilus TaxID=361280 RepID=A0ABU5C6R5_9BACI|nr:aspartyl-phosphate phosphatase Spo0E family protein [Virgibacillus halophilus]